MHTDNLGTLAVEKILCSSERLGKIVTIELYYHTGINFLQPVDLLLVNDGQNMKELALTDILFASRATTGVQQLLTTAIYTDKDRKRDYGVASTLSYNGLGDKAQQYSAFIIEELMPFLLQHFSIAGFRKKIFSGFSLGALSAFDIVWNHPEIFDYAGVFSGSLWWRNKAAEEEDYDENQHRIVLQEIRRREFAAGKKFFFQCGTLDETADRNNNGIIDSIDDTLDTIKELALKGYNRDLDICYLEVEGGRHDIATWGKTFPVFLHWIYQFDKIS